MEEVVIPRIGRLPSSRELLRWTFSFYAAHWQVFIGIALIPLLFVVPVFLLGDRAPAALPAFAILSGVVLLMGRLALYAAVSANGNPEGGVTGAFERGASLIMPFLFIGILTFLAVTGGFMLFVIPGIILSLALSFAGYVLFSEGYRGLAALVRSWQYLRGYWWSVFWRYLVFGLIAGGLFVLVGFVGGAVIPGAAQGPERGDPLFSLVWSLLNIVVLTPLSIIYGYRIYTALRAIRPALPPPDEPSGLRSATRLFLAFGIALLVGALLFAPFLLGGLRPDLGVLRSVSAGMPWPLYATFIDPGLADVFFPGR
ncbi:MAG: hypothetical protein Q8R13_03585 [bacterium]|nr:hypothetical protein [bacterium]